MFISHKNCLSLGNQNSICINEQNAERKTHRAEGCYHFHWCGNFYFEKSWNSPLEFAESSMPFWLTSTMWPLSSTSGKPTSWMRGIGFISTWGDSSIETSCGISLSLLKITLAALSLKCCWTRLFFKWWGVSRRCNFETGRLSFSSSSLYSSSSWKMTRFSGS